MDFHLEVELMTKDYSVCVLPCIDECTNIICEMFFISFICKRYCLLIIVLIVYLGLFVFPPYLMYCIIYVCYVICLGTTFVTFITLIVSLHLLRFGTKFSPQNLF